MKKTILFILILSFSLQVVAQKVYWAEKVDTVSSEYSYDRYGSKEIIGTPNVDRQGRNSIFAWAVVPNDVNKESVEMAFIEVNYGESRLVEQVAVFESFNPGAVAEIYISPLSSGDMWERIYLDTAVVARTGMSNFVENIDPKVADVIGKKHKDINVFVKDDIFQAQKGYNIKNVFFDAQDVYRVRVIINPLAIDGWNQIDAIGILNSRDSIRYPEPNITDQSVIIDKKSKNMGEAINSNSNELFPIVSPDEKRLYYSKKEFDKKKSIYSQNIWYSNIEDTKIYSCNPHRPNNFENQDVWQTSEPVYWEFNNVVPNTIVGFSSTGEYMYLNNLYENLADCDCEDVFLANTSGLSISHLDTTFWKEAETALLDSVLLSQNDNFITNAENTILLSTKYDSLHSVNYVFVQTKEKKDEWGELNRLGRYEQSPFSFNTYIDNELQRFWINVDSIYQNKIIVGALKWSQPKSVVINDFKNQSNYTSFYISKDGEHLFMAIQEDTTKTEGRDIYISFLNNDGETWGKPQNLEMPVNSIGDESSPFLDGDNTTLYFSSAGHVGFGEHDVFICERLDDTWLNWSEPQNLGRRINTPGSDVNFQIADKSRMGYFSAYEKTVGCDDKSDIFGVQMGKAITIHIKGVTRNVNGKKKNGLYPEIGNVDIALKAMKNNVPDGFRKIKFKSSKITGEYDIEITKMVEANKMTEFGFVATKDKCYQTDINKNKINFEFLNLSNPDWVVNIHQDLYLYGPKKTTWIPDNPDRTHEIRIDTVFVVKEIAGRIDTIMLIDTVYVGSDTTIIKEDFRTIYDTVIVYAPILIDAEGCPIIHSGGLLYGIQKSGTDEPAGIEEIELSYRKYFGYNESDIGMNESDFKILKNNFLESLKSPGSEVTVYIISSASQVPTTVYCSNFELARERAEEPIRRLKKIMKDNNIDEKRVFFETRYVVEGKKYENDPENIDVYRKYQYVKIWLYDCEE